MKHEKSMRVRIDPWDRGRMVKFLEAQAQKGWMFCGFDETRWNFRLIEPKKVHFSVNYFLGYIADNAYATQKLLEFREYCAHDGWELAGAKEEMQVFYSTRENPVPIDTDPRLEVRTMQIMALRKLQPTLKYYLLLTALSLLVVLVGYFSDPIRMLYDPQIFFRVFAYGGILLSLLLRVGEQYLWLWHAKRYTVRYGEYPHHLKRLRISTILCVLIVIGLVGWIWRYVVLTVLVSLSLGAALVVMLVSLMIKWLDSRPIERKTVVIIVVVVTLVAIRVLAGLTDDILNRMDVEASRYAPLGSTWAQYEEVPPISAEEYYGQGTETARYRSQVKESIFLAEYRGWQSLKYGKDSLALDYTVLEVKWDALYDMCLKEYQDSQMFPVDAAPWGAEQAFRYGTPKELKTVWLLCYEDRIVEFYAEEEPTPEQKALVADILGNEQNFENNENK